MSGALVSVFRLSKLTVGIDVSTAVPAKIALIWLSVKKRLCDPYRPELHYMRGPGPKWREKHGHAYSIRTTAPLSHKAIIHRE